MKNEKEAQRAGEKENPPLTAAEMFSELVNNNYILPNNGSNNPPPMPSAYETIPSITTTNTIPFQEVE